MYTPPHLQLSRRKSVHSHNDRESHVTILHPRDSCASSRILTDLGAVVEQADKEKFANRRQFFFASLAFCLGLGNIWRFPRQMLLFGDATYLYLYVFFCFTIGLVVLFFEVALGQYSSKGFMKVFAMCPVFEGISYAMALYCTVGNIFYNMINVYNLRYMYTVFATRMPHDCDNFTVCKSPDLPQSQSSEYKYFFAMNDYDVFSWKSAIVLLVLWIFIFVGVITRITKLVWVPMCVVIIVAVALAFTLVASLSARGTDKGLLKLFIPETHIVFKNIETWVLPLQQCFVSLGVGMGPIINFGSYSRFKSLAHIDCIIITCITVTCSIVAAMILFSSAGVIALERHKSVQDALWSKNKVEDFQVHILFTQLCNRLRYGLGHFTLLVFCMALVFTSFFTAIEFTTALLAVIENAYYLNPAMRIKISALVCLFSFAFGNWMAGGLGQKFMAATDTIFLGSSPLIIILCELIAVIYIYGMTNYCDDIEFMLGFVPSYYFQVQWLMTPVISLIFLILSLVMIAKWTLPYNDLILLIAMVILIMLPIIIKALVNMLMTRKAHKPISSVLHPREVIETHSGDENSSQTPFRLSLTSGRMSSTPHNRPFAAR